MDSTTLKYLIADLDSSAFCLGRAVADAQYLGGRDRFKERNRTAYAALMDYAESLDAAPEPPQPEPALDVTEAIFHEALLALEILHDALYEAYWKSGAQVCGILVDLTERFAAIKSYLSDEPGAVRTYVVNPKPEPTEIALLHEACYQMSVHADALWNAGYNAWDLDDLVEDTSKFLYYDDEESAPSGAATENPQLSTILKDWLKQTNLAIEAADRKSHTAEDYAFGVSRVVKNALLRLESSLKNV